MRDDRLPDGTPISVHCLAAYTCPECGDPKQQLTIAPLLPDGRVDMTPLPDPAGGVTPCNDCNRAQRNREMEDSARSRRENYFRRKHGPARAVDYSKKKPSR